MSDRSVAPDTEGFFGRATRTLSNNIESALMYVPPMLLLIALERTSLATEVIAAVYIGRPLRLRNRLLVQAIVNPVIVLANGDGLLRLVGFVRGSGYGRLTAAKSSSCVKGAETSTSCLSDGLALDMI